MGPLSCDVVGLARENVQQWMDGPELVGSEVLEGEQAYCD
jgi:hypothetical protein